MSYSYGQYDKGDFIQYTIKEGLSDNYISCIEQDKYGFIWIGTDFGLNRYDGVQFEKYYHGSPEGFLTSSKIHMLRNFRNNRMAVITRNGLQIVDTENFSIHQYSIPDSTPFIARLNFFNDAIEFQDGTIGACSSSGFYVFDITGAVIYRHDAYDIDDSGKKRISYGKQILSVPDGNAFVYVEETQQGLYNTQLRSFREVSIKEEKWSMLSQPPVTGWRSISQISDHEYMFLSRTDSLIYFNYEGSIRIAKELPSFIKGVLTWESKVFLYNDSTFLINGGYRGFYIFQFERESDKIHFDPALYLDEYKINCFYKDKAGRLWIGTSDGVLKQKIKPAFARVYHWPAEDHSSDGYSDAIRYKDKLYLSRYSADVGLVIINVITKKIEKRFNFFGMNYSFNEVYSMQMYYPDTLWLGTFKGMLWFDTKTGNYGKINQFGTNANSIQWSVLTPAGEDGYAWICDYLRGNVMRYHVGTRRFDLFNQQSKPALPFTRIKYACTDAYGDTWLAGNSLARWNQKLNLFDTLISVYEGPNKYNDDIRLIRADKNGSLWIHNADNGLLQYKIKTHEWVHYGMKEGFPSEVIQGMSPVIDHTLWMTNHNQLIRFDTETGKMETYDHTDGIPESKPVAWNIIFEPVNGELYSLYKDKVVIMPFDYRQDTSWGSELLFSKVTINNAHSYFFPKEELKLKTGENNLTVHFALIDYNDGQKNKFAYRMRPEDQWTNLDNQRILHLTNLSPGIYNVEIKATGKSGTQKTKTLAFSIAPPFWKTPWFLFICLVVVSSFIYFLYRLRITQFQRKANLDKLLSQTEMKALHAQMNPHFIFNSLNSIREMILNGNTKEASRFLANFAHLIRMTLDQSTQSFISLRHTMDYINRYIEMEKIRSSDFHFSMEADKALDPDETILPPLLIQPFVENAIWHGMNGEEKEINIRVHFKKNEDKLVCIIEDDGIGIETSLQKKNSKNTGHKSVSIANIKKRIELLNRKHDLHSSITITDKNTLNGHTETGTIVKITLPLEIIEA